MRHKQYALLPPLLNAHAEAGSVTEPWKVGRRFMPCASGAAIAARHLNRPVRVALDRHEDMQLIGHRHPFHADYKVPALPCKPPWKLPNESSESKGGGGALHGHGCCRWQ